jgi:primosomal protein N'
LIRVVISAATIGEATEIGRELAWRIQVASEKLAAEEKFAYFGPKPCPRAKIKDRYRLQILLKSTDLGLIREIVRRAVENIRLPHDSNLAIDVEPINIM